MPSKTRPGISQSKVDKRGFFLCIHTYAVTYIVISNISHYEKYG